MADDAAMDDAAYDIRPDLVPADDILVNYYYICNYYFKNISC